MNDTEETYEHLFTNRQESVQKIKNIDVGDYTYGVPYFWENDATIRVVIGRFCSIASEVTILRDGEHRTNFGSNTSLQRFHDWRASTINTKRGDITIGSDVWIGQGATILSGVTVGHGAVIGAKSVVAGDVAPYEVVAGNTARHVRFRFDPETVDLMLRLAWWDWDLAKILDRFDLVKTADKDSLRRLLDEDGL